MRLRNSWLGAICLSTASLVISSSVLAEPVKENIGLYGGNVMDIATMGSSPRLSMPVNDLLVNDNFIWAGVGDRDGRSSEAGVRARVSYCGTSAWWKPTSSDATFTDIQANDHVAALDGVSTPSDATYDAVLYMASSNETSTRLTKASKERSSVSGCSSFACWQFTDVTPPNTYGNLSAVAVEPSDADHVWAAYSNCIVESTDGGATWAAFGGSCTDDHEEIRTLVCDDLIAGTSSGAFAYAEEANYAVMDGVFGGFLADGDTFEFPSGAEVWAGVANTNTELYPLSFPEGGEVRFRAAIPEVEGTIAPAKPWINEINYDPEGTDSGEFVEFAAPEGFDATGWRFQLINGTTGAVYAANQLVNLTKTTSGGLDLYVVNRNAGGLRNGPDGVAVINPGPDGVHATADDSCEMLVSYEGVLTNAQGLCSGVTSVEITPNQEGEAPVGQSLQLTGTGSTYADFTWVAAANTNGAVNDGQTYGATSVAGPDTTINFKFEANPSPNNSPSFSTENVVISGGLAEYSVAIPPQDANQDYNSFLMYIVENDQSVMVKDIEVVMSGDDPTEPMDADMDGVPDDEDAFPNDPAASVDADEDGMPDAWNPDATQEQIDASELMLDDDPSTPSGGPMGPPVADFTGVFGGAQAGADNTFTVPSGSESWAGFANLNTELYPITLEEGGRISFTGSVADGGSAEVRFRFEYKPSPDTEPSYNTTSVTVSGADPVLYEIMLEPQGTNTYESFIMYIDTRDVAVTITDVVVDFGTPPEFAVMDGVFGGFLADGDTFEFPSGAEVWAGVANTNTELYPLSFPEGGEVRFRAAIPEVEGTIAPAKPWINEINYDPEGTDSGEFVEFAAPEGFDATGWRFQLINGTTGAVYAANQLVNLTKTTSGGLDLYVVNRNAGGLRNGPDGVAVINPGPDGVHATADDSCEMLVSYEGVLTNAQGLCSGVTSVEITPNQEGEAPVGQSLQLTGTGSTYADFTWVAAANTNGAVNDGQTYGATSVAGPDTTINFKFEANPSPNNSPSFSTENVVISGGLAEYSVAIPPQDANQDYNSFLMYIVENDQSVMVKDIEVVMSGDDPTEPMDADMDGVPDDEDAFPNDPAASVDADEDGMPDAWNPDATQEQIDASELMLDDDPSTPSGGPMGPPVADFTGVFGGAQAGADNTFTVPSGSESWAGFANLNTDLYPLVFEFGGSITFMGSVADGGTAEVQFRFEKKPSPDTEPSFNTEVVTIEGADPMMYQVEFEPQGTNSFESFIMYIDTRDVTVTITDVRVQPAPNPKSAVMDGVFDGFIAEGDTFEFPTGAAAWAGVANTNTALYPLSFPNGGEVRFKAGTPPEGGSTQVYFKFEANPYPNNNPSFDTSTALVSGELTDYTLEVPAQDPDQEYNSFLMYIVERDQPVMVENIEVVSFGPPDADDDGIPDSEDAFPNDPAASVDTDGDGMPDDWNEGVDDILISESTLTLDDDDDNDGYTDEEELADGTDPANADSTPFVPRSIIRLLLPILNSAL